jgi:hypothetical protein
MHLEFYLTLTNGCAIRGEMLVWGGLELESHVLIPRSAVAVQTLMNVKVMVNHLLELY